MKKPVRKKDIIILVLLIIAWMMWDLLGPYSWKPGEFDPKEVARLETEAWRVCDFEKTFSCYRATAGRLQIQHGFPLLRSYLNAYHFTQATKTFKKDRQQTEKILVHLARYIRSICRMEDLKCNPRLISRRILNSWKLAQNPSDESKLVEELTLSQAERYGRKGVLFQEYASTRANAMTLRNNRDNSPFSENAWVKIRSLLTASYKALSSVLSHSIK